MKLIINGNAGGHELITYASYISLRFGQGEQDGASELTAVAKMKEPEC